MYGYEWVKTNALYVTVITPDSVLVMDQDRSRAVVIAYDAGEGTGQLLFNGVYVDVGDDFPVFLGLMDEVADNGHGEVLIPAASFG